MDELKNLISEAGIVFKENFPGETWFERAIFFSWSCAIKDCTFCYMSTQERRNRNDDDKAVRSKESIYAEAILCKNLGWPIGFFTGGVNAYPKDDLVEMLKIINEITGEKVWISLGPIPESHIEAYKPYIKGVVGSIETVNEELHKKVCPSKPIAPYVRMFKQSTTMGLKNAMTIILGIGETKNDFETLKKFIEDNNIVKIHIYSLNPVKGTEFENNLSPSNEYHAWYIAKVRTTFPEMDIQIGIWKDKVERISLLLEAGANSISKFPVIREFGSYLAKSIESQSAKGNRKFKGSLTILPDIDWNAEVEKLSINNDLKEAIKLKLHQYLKNMHS